MKKGGWFLYSLFILWICALQSLIANEDQYWQDFKLARTSGRVKNVVDYVAHLGNTLLCTEKEVESKQKAISYFFATGGKHGFRSRPITSLEREKLIKPLTFISHGGRVIHPQKPIKILEIRRSYGRKSETSQEKKHLLEVQKVITATGILYYADDDNRSHLTKQLYHFEYLPVLLFSSPNETFALSEWDEKVREFSKIITKEFDAKAKLSFDEEFSFPSPSRRFGLLEPVTAERVQSFQAFIQKCNKLDKDMLRTTGIKEVGNTTPLKKPISVHKPMRVVLENGLIVERKSTGGIVLTPTRDISLGFMRLGAGSVMAGGTGISIGSLQLNNTQTEEEFLAALSAVSAILERTYL